ncbi:MAG TPA: phosphatase PAP2 family protein [Micromonosporaceae bacterium]|nr:phosphatase PAP2 family protein [Micromonosporaceae bacterium]
MLARPPLAVPLAALAGFVVLLGLVVGGWAPLAEADSAISEAFRGYGRSSPALIRGLRIATDLAATVPFVTAGAVASLLLLAGREWRAAAFCALTTALVPALWLALHRLLEHPRPRDGFVATHTNGFPSGHTSMATAAAVAAVLLLWPQLNRAGRVVTVVVAASFAVFIGLTRVALLAHWPVDVLGGWLLGLAVVPLVAYLLARDAAPTAPTSSCR